MPGAILPALFRTPAWNFQSRWREPNDIVECVRVAGNEPYCAERHRRVRLRGGQRTVLRAQLLKARLAVQPLLGLHVGVEHPQPRARAGWDTDHRVGPPVPPSYDPVAVAGRLLEA